MKLWTDFTELDVSVQGGVVRARLNRPGSHNALNRNLVRELGEFFNSLYWLHDLRVVVLEAAGPNFCVGADIKELDGPPGDTIGASLQEQRRIAEIVTAMRRCPQPIVARLQGAASGGGMALALASDIRIAAEGFRMNAAFIKVGLGGCDIGVSYFLPRMVGASTAAQYLLTGRFLTAERAYSLGLLAEIAKPDSIDAAVQSYLDDLLSAAPLGLRLTKEALNHAIDANSLDAVVAMEDRNRILCCATGDFEEGIAAFRELA